MQTDTRNVFTRPDTLFGVCQALGDDFGFNPNILRVAFGVPLVWSPYIVIAAYLTLAAVVALTRLLVPNPRPAQAAAPVNVAPIAAPQVDEPELALAA